MTLRYARPSSVITRTRPAALLSADGSSDLLDCQRAGGEGFRPNAARSYTITAVSDAHMRVALDKLVDTGRITLREKEEFLAHRQAQRLFVEDVWRRIDDVGRADPEAAAPQHDALNVILGALGWSRETF